MKKKSEEMGSNKRVEETEVKREIYRFTAYVNGPLVHYEFKAKDFDEAYAMGKGYLKKIIEDHRGRVVVEKIEVARDMDLPF